MKHKVMTKKEVFIKVERSGNGDIDLGLAAAGEALKVVDILEVRANHGLSELAATPADLEAVGRKVKVKRKRTELPVKAKGILKNAHYQLKEKPALKMKLPSKILPLK